MRNRTTGRFKILWTPVLVFVILFAFVAVALPLAAFIVAIAEQGEGPDDPLLTEIIFPIANWPSLLTKTYPMFGDENGVTGYDILKGLFYPPTLIANGLGWGLIGFLIGLGISAIMSLGKKRK